MVPVLFYLVIEFLNEAVFVGLSWEECQGSHIKTLFLFYCMVIAVNAVSFTFILQWLCLGTREIICLGTRMLVVGEKHQPGFIYFQ